MDAKAFLKIRTEFIRFYYDRASEGFLNIQTAIENEAPPFDDPPYSEDPEPPYLIEWLDAETGKNILGSSCIALLSESLKLYFNTLQDYVIRFRFTDEKKAFKQGFVAAYMEVLSEILTVDWKTANIDIELIEQIVLARNRGEHGGDLTTFSISHDQHTLQKHPKPFFANQSELENLKDERDELPSWLRPTLEITRERLFAATFEVEKLAAFIDGQSEKIWEWQKKSRGDVI